MEARLFLDTHVLVWVAAGLTHQLTAKAREAIEFASERIVSPMVQLELHYLYEIKRLGAAPIEILQTAKRQADVTILDGSLRHVVEHASWLTWTRDPFDRLIVGHAIAENVPLVTKDQTILANYPRALW